MSLKQTPLHRKHQALGAKIVPFAGFEMPVRYTSDKEEHMQVRNAVGVFDVSHMGEFFVEGPEAIDLIQKVTSNDVSRIIDGQAQYSCFPNDQGGIVDDLIVYRFNSEKYMLVVNASNIEKDWKWINQHNTFDAKLTDHSDEYALLAVQGPKAQEVLQRLTDIDLSGVKFYHFVEGKLAGKNMIISGTGYTGSGGFELYIPKNDAPEAWDALFEAGKPENIQPIGLGARDTLRLEMGFCLYGNDITDTTSPYEAGLGWITKPDTQFINAEQLKAQKEAGIKRKLVGFEVIDRGIPRNGYQILDHDGQLIGEVTSGTMSPSLGKGIGLGYVKMGNHQPDADIYIDIRGKSIHAKVVKPPFVK